MSVASVAVVSSSAGANLTDVVQHLNWSVLDGFFLACTNESLHNSYVCVVHHALR